VAAVACTGILGDFDKTAGLPAAGDDSSSPEGSAPIDATADGEAGATVLSGDASGGADRDARPIVDASLDGDAAVDGPPSDSAGEAAVDAAIDAPAGGFSFVAAPRAFVHANGTTSVTVTLQRGAGFTAPVTVTPTGLPAGITSTPVVVAASTGTLVFTGNGTTAIGTAFVVTLAGGGGSATATTTLSAIVSGVSGSLDTTYPASGLFSAGWGTIRNCFVQPDGKVVLVGQFAPNGRLRSVVVRLTVDGAIDTTFAPPAATFNTSGGDAGEGDIGLAGALQPDGNIVVASLTSGTTRVSRYLTTGAYDSSFQGQGWVTSPTVTLTDPGPAAPVMFVLQPNGDIIIGQGGPSAGALQRWRPDGTPDPSIGMVGTYGFTTVTPNSAVVLGPSDLSLAVGPDNALYVMGTGALPSGFSATFLMKLLSTTLTADTTYGTQGSVAVRTFYLAGPSEIVQGAALFPHSSPPGLPATGSTFFGFDTFDADGTNHMILMPAGAGVDPMTTSTTIGTDAAGNILLAGGALSLARFTPSRTLDTTFAGQGGETIAGVTGTPVCITGTSEGTTLVGVTDATRPVLRFWP
jgi:uncharacterized delta-60 repeat protein